MAACEAFENSVFLRALLLSMTTGERWNESEAGKLMDLHLITDCRSLYDHLHREGAPRAPSEKRLAIDLAGLKAGVNGPKSMWDNSIASMSLETSHALASHWPQSRERRRMVGKGQCAMAAASTKEPCITHEDRVEVFDECERTAFVASPCVDMFATCLVGARVQASLRKALCRSLFLSFTVHGLLET